MKKNNQFPQSVLLRVDDLNPYERNARKHADVDIAAIKNSIRRFGFNDPIGVWGDKNIIVEGHGRLQAAKELGMREVPCIRLDYLTDEERRQYTLAHNKTAELSEWDFKKLDDELAELANFEIDMSEFGFETDLQMDVIDRKEAAFHEKISVLVECKDDDEAEYIFQKLSEEGYICHISTL